MAGRKLRVIVEGEHGAGKTTFVAAMRNVIKAHGGTMNYSITEPTAYRRHLEGVNPPDDILGDYDIEVVERDAKV